MIIVHPSHAFFMDLGSLSLEKLNVSCIADKKVSIPFVALLLWLLKDTEHLLAGS
jgi:hypothetical protein